MKNSLTFPRFALALIATFILTSAGCDISFTMTDGYSFNWTGQTAEHSEEGTFDEGVTKIKIVNKFGNVNISEADGEPGWSWNAKVWADSQELADQFMDDLFMDVQTDGNTQTWTISLPESSSDLNGVKSNLTMKLPADVSAKIENRHGNSIVKDLTSNVDLNNAHGDVDINRVTGRVDAVNAHGDLLANRIAEGNFKNSHGDTSIVDSTSDVEIRSSHGSVRVEKIQGSLTVDGSHGDLIAYDVQNIKAENSHGKTRIRSAGERVEVDSAHGDIDLTMNSSAFKSIDLETSHAKIEVLLPASSDPAITMDTTHGKMVSEFEPQGGSGPPVELKNRHGDIKVRKFTAEAESTAEFTAESPAEATQ
jgi:hypothetical protein